MMGSPSPAASKLKKESPSSSSRVGPHRRTSSVASSCLSLELGDQDGLSPARSNGLGKSTVVSSTSSPRTPAGLEKSGSPAAIKKRRASIGGPDDLARGLDFGTSSPSTEEKKHPFLTRGGGHKKVATPATQTNSPGKIKVTSTTTPPGKEKLVAGRATAASVLSPKKLGEVKKDVSSPRRSVLASESSSMNGSLISEVTSGLVEVTPKKASPRASLDGKISAGKSSPRPNMKSVASTKGRIISNGGSASTDSPLDAETKFSPGKTLDGKIRKTSPVPSLKFKPGSTSQKSQKLAKTRQDTPSQPGRVKTRIEKAVRNEDLPRPELDSVAVPVCPENDMEVKSEDVVAKMEEDGSTLLPSLMVDGNVGDEDMSSLDQGGDPGFDNDLEMPTSWLFEDLPCMFSSLSHLPEPDDSSSSLLGDPPELLDEPFAEDLIQGSSELANPYDVIVAAEIMSRSPVSSLDDNFVAPEFPSTTSMELDESEWNYESSSFNLVEDSVEAELVCAHEDELESQQTLQFPAVDVPVAVSQGETIPYTVTTHPEEISSSNNVSPVTESVAHEASLRVTENTLTEERNLHFLFEGRSVQPVSSQSVEETIEVVTQVVPQSLEADGGICHFDSSSEMNAPKAISALQEEERRPAAEDEVSATQDQLVVASSDDESSEDFIEGSCSAQLNLKQSFDDAAEPAVSHNEVDEICDMLPRDSREDTFDTALEPMTTVALSTDQEILPEVTKVTKLEFADEPQDRQECGTFTPTHVDKDMMIFDFEEYWTHNAGDESFQSDAGQNDAEDLQPYCMRKVQLLSPVQDEAARSLPLIELPVSSLPGEESINLEPQSSPQPGGTQLDSQGWPCPNSTASFPASNTSQMDTKSANQEEFDEVFHPFEGSDQLSPKAVLFDNLSSPSKSTVELNHEPLAPILSQSKIAGGPDSRVSPRYTTLETEHSNGVDIGQVGQNLDVPEDNDVELEATEHQNSSIHTFLVQDSSVADLSLPKPDVEWSNAKAPVDQESLTQEDLDTPPISAVTSNGLLVTNILHLDDNDHASDESVDFEGPDDPEFSPVTMQGASQKSCFETPALPDAYMSDDSLDMGPENLSMPQVPEVCAISVQTAETTDDRDAAETDELLPGECQSSPNRDIASPAAGIDDSHDLISSEVDSSKLLMVESDQNILISSAGEEVDPLESSALAISLPPVNGISEEEQTEAIFLLSLDSKEESTYNKDSSTDHELQINLSREESQGRTELINGYDSGCLVGGQLMSEPKEKFQDISSESRESGTEVPEHDNLQMLSGALFPVEERNEEMQSQDDEKITTPALQLESHGDTVNMSEVDHEPQVPVISTPKTLQDDNETLHYVPIEEALPTGVPDESHVLMSDTCSPVFDQEDETLNAKFDSKSEVESTASLDEVDMGTDTVITAAGATINHTDTAESLGKGEAIYSTAATPIMLSAGELSNLTLNEVSEFNNKLGSEGTVDEEKSGIVGDFGEQINRAEQGWEEPLLAADSSGSMSNTEDKRDLLFEESMVTNATSSLVADERRDITEDLEIVSEQVSRTISTPVSTPNETIECHDHDFQGSHLPLRTPLSTENQVSRTEAALETEKVLVAFSDATFDDSDDHAIKGVEIVPEHFSSQDLPLERFVTYNQHTFNAAISDVDEMEVSDLTRFKEGENLNESPEPIPVLEDKDTVVNSPKKSFIHSSPDTAKKMDVDEREGTSAAQVTSPPEMYTSDTFSPENIHWVSPEQHSTEETVLENEETVVYSPKNSFVASGTPDTTILGAIDAETHSPVSWTASKEEESLNGNLEGESLLEDELVHSPKDPASFPAQNNPNTTNLGSNGIPTASWKDDNEDSLLEEKPLHKGEEMAVGSPKKNSVVSGEDTAILDVDEMEEHSWTGGKEEKSLNGSVERDEDEDQVLYSPKCQFNIPAEETPETATSGVNYIQNHSKNSWSGESFNGSLKEESLLEDEDTVVYKPTVEEFAMEGSSPKGVEKVVDSHMEIFKVPIDTVVYRPTMEESTPELMKGSSPEGVEKVVDSHMEIFNVPDHDTTDAAILIVEEQETRRDDMEGESFNGNLERESKLEIEESSIESFVAPDLLNENYTSILFVADELEKQTDKEEEILDQSLEGKSTFEIEQMLVESSKESFVAPDLQNATNTSNLVVAEELEKQTDQEEEILNQSLEEKPIFEAEETVVESSEKESFVAPDLINAYYTSNLIVAEKLEKQTDKEEETLDQSPEAKSMFEVEETAVESPKESFVAPDPLNSNYTSNLVVADVLEKQADKEEETLEEKSMSEVEQKVVERSNESFVAPDQDKAAAETLDAGGLDKHLTWKTPNNEGESLNDINPEEESIQDTVVDSSSDNVKKEAVSLSDGNGATQSSSGPTYLGSILVASNANLADEGDKEPHESDSQIADAVHADRVKNSLDVPGAVQTDTVAKDSDFSGVHAVVEESCMTNGEKLDDSSAPVHETSNVERMQNSTAPTDSQADTTPDSTEPQSPTATLYPLSKPPFSGSQQDRLWEEQAEAYNSGQGTPSRKEDHATQAGAPGVSPSPGEKPTSSEDQIQPVAAASNGNHAVVVGPSNGAGSRENGSTPVQDQPKGNRKEKLHTPLRSLLLEDASHGDPVTPNGVSSSPSFIRRLFRVMSTSRSADREVSQAKLKRSASMWVSCLGSPQVKQ